MKFIEGLTPEIQSMFQGFVVTFLFLLLPAGLILTGIFLSNIIKNKKVALVVKVLCIILGLAPSVYLTADAILFSNSGPVILFFIPIIIVYTLISIAPVVLPILFAFIVNNRKKQNKPLVSTIVSFIIAEVAFLVINIFLIK